jgi:TonB family protein
LTPKSKRVFMRGEPIIAAMRISKGILQFGLWVSVALTGSPLARAQDAVPGTLGDFSKRTEATPTLSMEIPRSKPSLEISAATTPVVKQTPSAEEPATPATTVEEDTPRVRRRAIVQPKAPPATPTSLAAAKSLAISAPLPDYPYEARRAHVSGSGVCVMTVNTASGNVASAIMTESTGNALLDKITTDTLGRWRFKPGTVSQVQVPITYR